MRLHAYAYLNQYKGIESGEVSDNLSQRLDDLVDVQKYFIEEAIGFGQLYVRSTWKMLQTGWTH